jgi:ABC-type branched-subunit amino acid transport system ATPase component/ABC-type branched-subunit amino acid transport system permease subunit
LSQHASFLLLGLANGAVFAALGLALVVTYRSSSVMNFATSTIALFGAYTYSGLRRGELVVLVPGLPDSVDLGEPWGFWPSAVVAILLTSVLGVILYGAVFRPLRAAPAAAKAVASLGVMVVMTGAFAQRQGTHPPPVARIFPLGAFHVGDVTVSKDRVFFALSVVAIALVIGAVTRFTRFGLLTRAAAVTEKGAFVSGISPDRLAAMNSALSAGVAGAAGILIAPIVPLVPVQYTLFIVPALAIALLGGFERMAPVVAGGLLVGMLQSETAFLQVQHTWLPSSGLAELVPLALILIVLVARAKPLPSRGVVLQRTLGRAPRPRRLAAPAVIGGPAALVALGVLDGSWRAALLTSLILAIVSLSYVVVTGYSGQISLAQLTLAGVAGFLLGPLTVDWRLPLLHSHVPFPIAPLLAAVGAAVVGVVIGLPAVRIRGLPVAVVTLALAVAVEAAWFRNTDFVSSSGKNVAGPDLFGVDLRVGTGLQYPRYAFCALVVMVLVGVALAVARLRTSRLGTNMLAVRANERSAAAAGIDVVRTKVAAFAIGSFIAGLGGALLAYKQGNVTYDSFAAFLGLGLFATAYLAGMTSVSGGIVAGLICANGIVFKAMEEWFSLGRWYGTIAGLGLVLTVVRNPEGIVGPFHQLIDRRRRPAGVGQVTVGRRSDEPAVPPEPATGATGASLKVQGLGVRYGGVLALDAVSFTVPAGRIVGLIGPNGAGKTTLVDAITGFTGCEGDVRLGDRSLSGLRPFERVRAGLGRTFQAIELYDDLSVRENVAVGQGADSGSGGERREHLAHTLSLLGLDEVRDRPAGELSQGARQLVSIARALVGQPEVLVLDEPAGGLDPTESAWLGQRLREVRASGVTILLIDHDMQLVLDLCDEIQVLDFGLIIAAGTPAEVRADPAVAAAYLGSMHGREVVQP